MGFVIPGLVVSLASWIVLCNVRTAGDRRILSLWAFGDLRRGVPIPRDWERRSEVLLGVSWDRHFWRRITLRDPAYLDEDEGAREFLTSRSRLP